MNKYDQKHQANLRLFQLQIGRIFKAAAEESAAIAAGLPTPDDGVFSFDDHPRAKRSMDALQGQLAASIQVVVVDGINTEWALSNAKNDALVDEVLDESARQARYYRTNDEAREAFIQRKEGGLTLSDRVWKYSEQFKEEIEAGIDCGLRYGLDAQSMARQLKQYLQHPDKLFRRVRDEHGNLQLSKMAAAFHPGQGVYRSSYKNARRLAATETNMAYRTADYERWQQLDFIVGIEVHLSNNHTCLGKDGKPHPFYDICDELKGKYPKDFKFTGWHPHCRCIATTITKTEAEMDADDEAILRGEQPSDPSTSENAVTELPDNFKQWVEDNQERMERAKSLPYFMSDNAALVDASAGGKGQTIEKVIELAAKENETILVDQIYGTKFSEEEGLTVEFLMANSDETEEFREQIIPLENIHSVQDKVYAPVVKRYMETKAYLKEDDLPMVAYAKGNYYVVDGNHRIAAAIANGEKKLKVSLCHLDDNEFNILTLLAEDNPQKWIGIITGSEEFEGFDKLFAEILEGEMIERARPTDLIKSAMNHFRLREDVLAEQYATQFTEQQIENHLQVSKALGLNRGERMSFKDADSGRANPKFSWFSDIIGKESPYNTNCTMVVATHELRMRGWDVTSLPLDKSVRILRQLRVGKTNEIWIDPITKEPPKAVDVLARTREKTMRKFEEATAEVGRYHFSFHWKDGGGHIMCVDRLPSGELRFYDPQSNILDVDDWSKDFNLKKGIKVTKVDKLLINSKVIAKLVKAR